MASPAVLVLGIVGSGIMAAGIAEVALIAGHDVVVRSRSIRGANDVAARVAKNLDRRVERGKLDAATRDDALTRLTVTAQISDLAHCSIVLESIVEDMDSKVALLRELDTVVSNRAILATNTSTLSVSKLAMTTSHPNRVCGIHFFNPATTMPLVNALLFPYLNNAIKMMERGTASMDDIDTAMKGGCNFPMGPFALLDLVGLDTSLSILRTLHEASGNPADAPAETLLRLVADGHLGRKTGQGFHTY
ncbi:MAG: 3-hydroxybutyryl-CoA dehydrogenase [Actinobacteria bacterium]|nr:3-hydroxybutyryl-CoA dehydrogenase [Actinomycetota bacterium]